MYPQVFGKYVLERELARGGMARVVLATLRGAGGFEKRLVVKQIRDELACDEEFVRRFVEEAKTTVALAHPNIVPVYELGVELGTYFLAMEFVEGASCAELLRTSSSPGARAGLSPEEGAYVGVEVCRALDYAHRRMNVVHRDVTPRNVMVDEEGQVKVIDFGIAAPVATAPSGHGVFGSPGHMPPEQMEGKELTPAADVFAVAVLLMELWSGRAPFRRRTNDEIDLAMRAPHPKPSDVDIRLLPLDGVIASAMSLEAKLRPQQADDLARALRRFLAGIDLGDLAHQLGGRVRHVRAHPPLAPSEPKPILQRPPSRPTATQVGTKTFAAREDVRVPQASASIPEASTRRVVSNAPPLAVREVETMAMRPIETDPRGEPGAPRPRFVWLGVAGAGAVAIAAFFLGRGAATPWAKPEPSATPVAPMVPPAAPFTAVMTGPALPDAASVSPVAVVAASIPAAIAERAQLVLLGDGTSVRVDGVPRGPCPAHVAVDPGPHAVVFSFPATGESKSESLTLRPGDRVLLSADFTGAAPVIRTRQQ
jgi:eukaryotic-like serine/threonine-protein kinase